MTSEYRFIKLFKIDLGDILNKPSDISGFSDAFCMDQTWDVIDNLLVKQAGFDSTILHEVIKEGFPIPMDTPMMEIFNPTFLIGKDLQNVISELKKVDVEYLLKTYTEEIPEIEGIFFPQYFDDMELDQQRVMLRQDLKGIIQFYSSVDVDNELVVKYLGC